MTEPMPEPEQVPTQEIPGAEADQVPPASAPVKRRRRLRETLALVAVLALAAILRLFVYESDIVSGTSMRPGLRSGDYLLICKLGYEWGKPRRFDVVTFASPVNSGEVLVKRVVALPGEWALFWRGAVFINGRKVDEPYATGGEDYSGTPTWVPPGHVFVLGDNRENSEDSRMWGPVPLENMRGKGVAAFYPFDRAHWLGAREVSR